MHTLTVRLKLAFRLFNALAYHWLKAAVEFHTPIKIKLSSGRSNNYNPKLKGSFSPSNSTLHFCRNCTPFYSHPSKDFICSEPEISCVAWLRSSAGRGRKGNRVPYIAIIRDAGTPK